MHELSLLRDLVILVAVAIPVVVLAQRLRVPSVVGFLLTGLFIGPHALGLIGDSQEVRGLAEIGVLLLLFTIGLELSLSRVFRMRRIVLQGGGVQVVGTILVVTGVVVWVTDVPPLQAVFFGSLVALSSTAIVLRVYAERGELDTPHGRVAVAILLFQDLCIVPLMLLAPLLAGAQQGLGAGLVDVLLPLAIVGSLVLGGRLLIPWLLEQIVRLRNREIFTLSIVLIGLSAAYLTASFGLSLALGAFLAGLIISESPYGAQALSDVLPFRDTFSGIFFISVGMLLDLGFVWDNALVLALKSLIAAGATRALKWSTEVSVLSGLGLAQVGEFSFVLALVGLPLGLLNESGYQIFLGTSVLSMLLAPLIISGAPAVAKLVCRLLKEPAVEIAAHEEQGVRGLNDHVIIVGYGLNGRNLARVLKAAGISYIVLEQNGQAVRRCRREKEPVYFGDGTQDRVLERVGIERARVIVFAIASVAEERRGVAVARHLNPRIRIVVRTRYVAALDELRAAGADEVIPEEFETSIEIFARVLRLYGVAGNVVEREVSAVRGEAYEALRGLSMPDLRPEALEHYGVQAALDTVEIEPGARAVGENPVSLGLRRETGATVIVAVRGEEIYHSPNPEFRFEAGDVVVLVGDREARETATTLPPREHTDNRS